MPTQRNRTEEILLLAPVDWEAEDDRLSTDERYELERAISQDCVRLARFSAYVSRRLSGGTHADAVKRQNTVAGRVRLALGYTYRHDDLHF